MQATSVSDPKKQAPSNELVERVARAMVYKLSDQQLGSHPPSPENDAEFWQNAREVARAAIAAMREPTEAMQVTGAHMRENRKPVAEIWRAMIDEALR